MRPEHGQTVIVGGGIAGICAAATLVEQGCPVLVLDQSSQSLGGRVAQYPPVNFTHRGIEHAFTMEHGIHAWWRQYRNFAAFIERQGLSHELVDAREQTIVFKDGADFCRINIGRESQSSRMPEPWHHVGLLLDENVRRLIERRELPGLFNLGLKIMESVLFDPTSTAHRERYDRMSVQDFTSDIPDFFRAFLKSLSRSAFFSDPGNISLWSFFVALQLYVFLGREDQCFSFLRGPVMGRLMNPIIERIEEKGGQLSRGVTVESVQRRPEGGWLVHWRPTTGAPNGGRVEGAGGVVEADNLVLAVDVEAAKTLAESSPVLEEVLGDLSMFEGRRSTVVRLWFERPPSEAWGESGVFGGDATADNFFWLHRFQDEFQEWHRQTGGGAIECHVYTPDHLHELADAELFERVLRDVEGGFPEVAGSCVHRALVRNPGTHTTFPLGCAVDTPTVRTKFEDLALCGDWVDGAVPVLYMERACQTGIAAANEILTRAGLPEVEILSPTQPRRHVQLLQTALRAVDRVYPALWPTRAARGSGSKLDTESTGRTRERAASRTAHRG